VLDLFPDVPVQAHPIRTTSVGRLLIDGYRAIRAVRRQGVDVAISLEVFSRAAAALVYLSRASKRVGYHRFFAEGCNCGDLYTHRVQYSPYHHMSTAFLVLAEASTHDRHEVPLLKQPVPSPLELLPMSVSESERAAVFQKLSARGYPADQRPPLMVFNVNSSDLFPLRRWPREHFERLLRLCLDAHPEWWIALCGAPNETAENEHLALQLGHPRLMCLAGQTSLRELVVLFSLAEVLVANDSGPAQFAALTPISVVSLFGPETPLLYAPLSPRNRSLSTSLACSPCIGAFNQRHSACRDNVCMQTLTVEQVFAAVEQAYAERTVQNQTQPTTV
jgi:ADP-heptose:LPS heptosyltransferase